MLGAVELPTSGAFQQRPGTSPRAEFVKCDGATFAFELMSGTKAWDAEGRGCVPNAGEDQRRLCST